MTNWLACWLVINLFLTFISLLVFIGPFLQSRSQTKSRAFFRPTLFQEGASTAFAVVLVIAWKLSSPEAQSVLDRITLYLQAFLKIFAYATVIKETFLETKWSRGVTMASGGLLSLAAFVSCFAFDQLRVSPMLFAASLAPCEAIKIGWASATLLKLGTEHRRPRKWNVQREETPQPIALLIELLHSMLEIAVAWSFAGYMLVGHDRPQSYAAQLVVSNSLGFLKGLPRTIRYWWPRVRSSTQVHRHWWGQSSAHAAMSSTPSTSRSATFQEQKMPDPPKSSLSIPDEQRSVAYSNTKHKNWNDLLETDGHLSDSSIGDDLLDDGAASSQSPWPFPASQDDILIVI